MAREKKMSEVMMHNGSITLRKEVGDEEDGEAEEVDPGIPCAAEGSRHHGNTLDDDHEECDTIMTLLEGAA